MKWSYAGWLVAAGVVLAAIMKDVLKDLGKALANRLARALFARLRNNRFVHTWALRGYRSYIVKNFSHVPNPFLDNHQLAMHDVYIPLQVVSGGADALSLDAHKAVQKVSFSVILGDPGAGKSTLLKHAMLSWAEMNSSAGSMRMPVLVELHRLENVQAGGLEELVRHQLALARFPVKGDALVRALRAGRLRVMFDGLDEVASELRTKVAAQIVDFARFYERSQVAVTCRTAVYERQFAEVAPAVFQIAAFDDRLIQLFLQKWPAMRNTRYPELLLESLRKVPRVYQLARNPLMLTMIAFLYGDLSEGRPLRRLPHQRVDFYQEVTEELLKRRKGTLNRFPWQAKKKILQAIALSAMESHTGGTDRLALPYAQTLAIVKTELPTFNIDNSHAPGLLDEIVQRSGLLIALDGGEHFQFAHLTIQEYLAALDLENSDRLMALFSADPNRWREVVKLWCGASSYDSTDLIRLLLMTDPVLAIECLSDASSIDPDFADKFVAEMLQKLLGGETEPQHPLVVAFGIAATDLRPRGAVVYELLVHHARRRHTAAVFALAATNLPEAAAVLGELMWELPAAREALVRLGDLAITYFSEAAVSGQRSAVDALATIGTLSAISALVDLIWSPGSIATRAAWHLAVQMQYPTVEGHLGEMHIDSDDQRGGSYEWIWAPWARRQGDPQSSIVGRVFELLSDPACIEVQPNARPLDLRILIPLCFFRARRLARPELPTPVQQAFTALQGQAGIRRSMAASHDPAGIWSLVAQIAAGEVKTTDAQSLAQASTWVINTSDPMIRYVRGILAPAPSAIRAQLGVALDEPSAPKSQWLSIRAVAQRYEYEMSGTQLWVKSYLAVATPLGMASAAVSLCVLGHVHLIAVLANHWTWGTSWLGWPALVLGPCFWLGNLLKETPAAPAFRALSWAGTPLVCTYSIASAIGLFGVTGGVVSAVALALTVAVRLGGRIRERRSVTNPLRDILELGYGRTPERRPLDWLDD